MINNNRNGYCRNNTCRNSLCRSNTCGSTAGASNGGSRNCRALLSKLRAVDFALNETVLYLDMYPDCREGKAFYHKLVAERKELVSVYESQCGPLTMYGNGDGDWDWAKGPWPWEADAN